MAKIVTITNPLTGQPAQVDQLDHTAQQIDDGLNIARNVSNPNLLDNWYFGNPVDQRQGYVVPPGVTFYASTDTALSTPLGTTAAYDTVVERNSTYAKFVNASGAYYLVAASDAVRGYVVTGAVMTIDRWIMEGIGTLIIQNNGILLQKASGADYVSLAIRIENTRCKATDIVSASALANNVLVKSSNTIQNGLMASGFTGNSIDRIEVYDTPEIPGDHVFRFVIGSENAVLLQAAKLELGSQQTLAHQDENGVWQLNEIPDYGEQLARCQRVLIPVLPWVCYSGRIDNEGIAYIEIPTPVSMRGGDVPVIIGAKNGLVYHASGLKDVTYGVVSFGANSVTITASGIGITNQVCSGCFSNKVFLSKEL